MPDFGSIPTRTDSPVDEDELLWNMCDYMLQGNERDEARLLLTCSLSASAEERSENWGSNWETIAVLRLEFSGPRRTYELLRDTGSKAQKAFEEAATAFMPASFDELHLVSRAQMSTIPGQAWRDEAWKRLDGQPVSNQGILGSKAPLIYRGLRFRSRSEVKIAEALDRMRVMYLPNCAGRIGERSDTRETRERDFVIFLNGKWGVLEVDGGPFHPPERSATEHERDRVYKWHGAAVVERFDSERCFKEPDQVVAQFLTLLKGH